MPNKYFGKAEIWQPWSLGETTTYVGHTYFWPQFEPKSGAANDQQNMQSTECFNLIKPFSSKNQHAMEISLRKKLIKFCTSWNFLSFRFCFSDAFFGKRENYYEECQRAAASFCLDIFTNHDDISSQIEFETWRLGRLSFGHPEDPYAAAAAGVWCRNQSWFHFERTSNEAELLKLKPMWNDDVGSEKKHVMKRAQKDDQGWQKFWISFILS